MPTRPAEWLPLIIKFQPLFPKSVWANARSLLVGAILAMGNRTVAASLRVLGKSDDELFQNYHRVLNRARWSALEAGRLLLLRLLRANTLIKAPTKIVRTAAWYAKEQPPFSEAPARVRRCGWSRGPFQMSYLEADIVKIPRSLLERLTDAVCYAA